MLTLNEFIEAIKAAKADGKAVQVCEDGAYSMAYWSLDEESWVIIGITVATKHEVIPALIKAGFGG